MEHDSSPAARFAAHQQRVAYPQVTEFVAQLPFAPDEFQRDAITSLEDGNSVLVCAPTGAGKTVVGEFAAYMAVKTGQRCFYTTPIKALSNQKYNDFAAQYGADDVGLLTGDVAINSHAPIVVMTTEVLRNMLYARSLDLAGLGAVVLDEVHYLADRFRGAVWEEVILNLPAEVAITSLSATISNSAEFGAWLRQVRGNTHVIVSRQRPVPLFQHMMVGTKRFDLFYHRPGKAAVEAQSSTKINPALRQALVRRYSQTDRFEPVTSRGRRSDRGRPARVFDRVNRSHIVASLDRGGLLPAIMFIFSRIGCDAAVQQCVRSNVWLTDEDQREQIRTIIAGVTDQIPEHDLLALDFYSWAEALERGVAAHHAGLLPAFKVAVEQAFVAGLIKIVFATETLALGINMPARSVVLEQLSKFNGETVADITPGEYTQLTGRAGRRGIDIEGHAVVLAQPGIDPDYVARLAGNQSYPLVSSFQPQYNMTINLVGRLGIDRGNELIRRSFAQFQSNRKVVTFAGRLEKLQHQQQALSADLTCSRGDITEYFAWEKQFEKAKQARNKRRSSRRNLQLREQIDSLRRGDVIFIPGGKRRGFAVVLDTRRDPKSPLRPLVATEKRWAGRLNAAEFGGAPIVLTHLRLGKYTEHWVPKVRQDLASQLKELRLTHLLRKYQQQDDHSPEAADLAMLERAARTHPVAQCPDVSQHRAAMAQYQQLERRIADLSGTIERTEGSLSRRYRDTVALLQEYGYLTDNGTVTEAGTQLARIWSVNDLLVAECLRHGIFDDLMPAELAAVAATLLFESRQRGSTATTGLGRLAPVVSGVHNLSLRLRQEEAARGLPMSPEIDTGLLWATYTWAQGGSLATTMRSAQETDENLLAGDVVRWLRQTADLLQQLAIVGTPELRDKAEQAQDLLQRGVVASAMV